MTKTPKHRSTHRWDEDDDASDAPVHKDAQEELVAEPTEEPKEVVPPTMVTVKCITPLHPWTELRYLEMNEVTDVTERVAQILLDKNFVELVTEAPPP